jgi:glucokinase
MIVFSGDVGGTHARMLLTEFTDSGPKVIKHISYNNSKYSSFADIISAFLAESKIDPKQIASACFGVAGPIVNGAVQFTNLPWVIREGDIKTKLQNEKVELINDFSAIGYGIEILRPEDYEVLQEGKPRKYGNVAFIGAGTGLGVGYMTWCQGNYIVHPTEGGHVDFAPTNETQMELLRYLKKKYHRVSFERVLTGQGLVNLYHFVRDNKMFGEEENPALRFLIESDQPIDIAATISEYAVKHKDIMAMRALDIFINVYGAAVGNLALTTLPYGGLYVVGGIAPKLLPQIKKSGFLEMFGDKGRMSKLIKDIPLYAVTNTDLGLHGAAVYARRIAVGKKS